MCDTLCIIGRKRGLFAKNSDRPLGEPQLFEAHPSRTAGGDLRLTHVTIEDVGAYALAGSRPAWCWGMEHGVNEHRVAIGNEKVWTIDDPRASRPALIGMDLVRLGLERARDADEALEVITSLLERHGQGGNCEANGEPYWSSFLVVDPERAWVLETSGLTWVARAVDDGAAISNRISIGTDWDRASPDVPVGADFDAWRDPAIPTEIGDRRLAVTRRSVASGDAIVGPRDLAAVLRDHGGERWGGIGDARPAVLPPADVSADFDGITVCMHLRGSQATAAGMIADLPSDPAARPRAWACLGSPCTGIFLPLFPPHDVPGILSDPSTWDRCDSLRGRVEARPEALGRIRNVLAPLEARLWEEADTIAPGSEHAFVASIGSRVEVALTRLGV